MMKSLRLYLSRVRYWREGYRKLALENAELRRSLSAYKGHSTRRRRRAA